MPFEKIPLTEELLSTLGVEASDRGGLAYSNGRAKIMLICIFCGSGPDFYERLTLFDAGIKFPISLKQKLKESGKIFTTFVLEAEVTLSASKRARLKKFARECMALYVDEIKGGDFNVEVLDKTKTGKPRSIAKLKKFLENFARECDKMGFRSQAMDLFIPMCFSVEEARLFDSHIQANEGKGIPLVSMLIFELGYGRYKTRISKTEGTGNLT